jgi:protein tyrosine phosphatase (PTP) superfamily phosphohydrolase (DUF442 family)
MIPSLQEIEAFLLISPTLATSGQPTTEQFSNILSQSYNLVINLATSASSNWNPNEKSIVEGLGMKYVGIPIDWENPTLNEYQNLADLLDKNSNCQIWVHCAKNMRVSAMIYLYHRLRKGYTEETSRRYLEQIWQPNQTWQNFINTAIAVSMKN